MTLVAPFHSLAHFNSSLSDTRKQTRQQKLVGMIEAIKSCDYNNPRKSLENRAHFIRKTPSQVFEKVEQFKCNLNIFQDHLQTLQSNYKEKNGKLVSYIEKFPLLRVSSIMKILWRALIQDLYSETGAIVNGKKQDFLVNKSSVEGSPVVSIVCIDPILCLGEGSFTEVFRVFDIMQHCLGALKTPRNSGDITRSINQLKNECRVLQDLHSPSSAAPNNIIDPPYQVYDMINLNGLYFLLYKKYPSDLFDIIYNRPVVWTRPMRIRVTQELFNGLNSLYDRDYRHGDIKPENVLVTDRDNLKCQISDLGDAHKFSEYESNELLSSKIKTHSPSHNFRSEYLVLERNLDKKNWIEFRIRSEKQDVFCLAVTLYELFTRKMPYSYKENSYIAEENGYFDPISVLDTQSLHQVDVPDTIKDVIISCLNKSFKMRPLIKEAIDVLTTIKI